MYKFLGIIIVLIHFTSWSFAADFQPIVLTLTAPSQVQYDFDGSGLTIPFTVAGTPATIWLVINTKGQADKIIDVKNGYLGWHYVNKIDTTVYISSMYNREIGEASIVWDGKDQDGNPVEAGTYDYYLWAYDDKSHRKLASQYVNIANEWKGQHAHIYELSEDGLTLPNPLIFGSYAWYDCSDEITYKRHGTHFKWVLGSDPVDLTLLQTTICGEYPTLAVRGDGGWFKHGGPVLNPNNYDIFYHQQTNVDAKTSTPLKWEFVSDGEAIKDEDWGGWDNIIFEEVGNVIGADSCDQTLFTDRMNLYANSYGKFNIADPWNVISVFDFEGNVVIGQKQFIQFYMPDDPNPSGHINSSFQNIDSRGNNHWYLLPLTGCLMQMIDFTRLLVDPDDETDMVVFGNGNGDYWMDTAYEPETEPAWYCFGGSKVDCMRKNTIAIDSNGFNLIGTSYLGLTSFGVSTQDGTAVGYMSFADDTISDDVNQKGGVILCDGGTAYDGLYTIEALSIIDNKNTGGYNNTYFVAFDSVHGIISTEPVAVEEEELVAFSVDQNSPNPFNPATTIGFTLPDADHVTVDIYNVTGQKVDTLINDFMDAGKHSVIWDASGFSAGVYFYTIKSGDYSRTMKMTLLK